MSKFDSKNCKKLMSKITSKSMLIVLCYFAAIVTLMVLSALFQDTYGDFFLCGALILVLRITNLNRRKFAKSFVEDVDSVGKRADIIEQKAVGKKVKLKEILLPILLVLFSIVVPITSIVLGIKFDSYGEVLVCFGFFSFIFAMIALVLYIRDNKCFKLIKSLISEVFYGFVLFCSIVDEGKNMGFWKIGLFSVVLYLIFGFYNVFKLWYEGKLENKKWYNKWRIRIILVVTVGLLLGLLVSFLTVQCVTNYGFVCGWFTRFINSYMN